MSMVAQPGSTHGLTHLLQVIMASEYCSLYRKPRRVRRAVLADVRADRLLSPMVGGSFSRALGLSFLRGMQDAAPATRKAQHRIKPEP